VLESTVLIHALSSLIIIIITRIIIIRIFSFNIQSDTPHNVYK